jgi:hypothetical protein
MSMQIHPDTKIILHVRSKAFKQGGGLLMNKIFVFQVMYIIDKREISPKSCRAKEGLKNLESEDVAS